MQEGQMTQATSNETPIVTTNKNLEYYLALKYPMEIVEDDGRFVAAVPDLPGCFSFGDTLDEAAKNLESTKRLWLKGALESAQLIPEPTCLADFSGKFVLRIPRSLHCSLDREARKQGISLNQYIAHMLSERHRVIDVETTIEKVLEKWRKAFTGFSPAVFMSAPEHLAAWEERSVRSHHVGAFPGACSQISVKAVPGGNVLPSGHKASQLEDADLLVWLDYAPQPPKAFKKLVKQPKVGDIYESV
jgi:antitoxin HicB